MTALVAPGPPLAPAERERFSRQIMLPGMGEDGQRRLRAARVLVIGAGGLGAPCLMGLAAAGVGTLGIVDDDAVELSNLQRQLLHGAADIGRRKIDSARDGLRAIDPDLAVEAHGIRLSPENAAELLARYDLVVDGSDNFATRYLVDDAAAAAGIPVVWGSVLRDEGQVSVFSAADRVRYRDLYPDAPSSAPDCGTAGVFGPLCAIVGSQMAAEAIKLVTGRGRTLLGRLVVIDALGASWREVALRPAATGADPGIVTAAQLRGELAGEDPPFVVDVRGPDEDGGIPDAVRWELAAIEAGQDPPRAVADAGDIVLHCAIGVRSRRAAEHLAARDGWRDRRIRSLAGGLAAWRAQEGEPAPSCAVPAR
ncbi:molybdopterin-synthase adenylyltransferase MoeB [Microbacterium karelineae]|uniref:molybdopterin-synthase adenylyltransferase MoeB n=1 Tax=Microbacterium karelineae TaxID=2654283 RepID=UPI001E5CEBC2|nr:molybdopterin-synthase adenylyltransferase MoeB [Microbacterium karelineae]